MANLQSWFENECLLHIRYTTCIGGKIFMVLMLELSDQKDGKAQNSLTSNGAISLSTEVRDFA